MKAVIQRVKSAELSANGKFKSKIKDGLLVLLGVAKDDTVKDAEILAKKTVNIRIFCDENDKMNLSVKDKNFEILSVSNFTLISDTKKGNRPYFGDALNPKEANELYNKFCSFLKTEIENSDLIKTGEFGADMEIKTSLSGPVTINLNSKDYNKEK